MLTVYSMVGRGADKPYILENIFVFFQQGYQGTFYTHRRFHPPSWVADALIGGRPTPRWSEPRASFRLELRIPRQNCFPVHWHKGRPHGTYVAHSDVKLLYILTGCRKYNLILRWLQCTSLVFNAENNQILKTISHRVLINYFWTNKDYTTGN